jgi:hypothetical protein
LARLFNQYSFLIISLVLILVLIGVLVSGPGSRLKQLLAVLLVVGLAVAFFLFQPGAQPAPASEVEALLANSPTPVLVEVYSNY